jgi:hypothetical protein
MAAESPYAIFRQNKISNYADFAKALGHSNRDLEVPNANSEVENEVIVSTSLEQIKERCESARTRKDNVLGYDLLFTASPEFFTDEVVSGKMFNRWKNKTIEWIEQNFGGKDNIVNLAVHLDESTPHISCQTVAIHEGKLNAKHFTGGTRHKMSELQDSYAEAMASFGLKRGERGSLAKHETIKKYYARANEAEANALDQLRVSDFQVELEPPKTNMFNIINEDHEDYFARHFEKMKPKIKALIDENRQLRSEIIALQREVKHWRSARAWTKQKSESLQKMKSKCNQLSIVNRKLNATIQEVEEAVPGFIRKLQRERGERTR